MSDQATVFYHRTTHDSARRILAEGFIDHEGSYMTGEVFKGVWLSDRPLDGNEGAKGKCLLKVTLDIPIDELDSYEWIEDEKTCREWLMPADLVNEHMKVEIMSELDNE